MVPCTDIKRATLPKITFLFGDLFLPHGQNSYKILISVKKK